MRAIVERAADEIRGEATSRGGEVGVRGDIRHRSRGTRCCCARRSAICAATRSKRASIGGIRRVVDVEGTSTLRSGRCRIDVVDNGPGVDPAVAPRMFRPFFTTKARGTGLGLALVQKIIVTHNGRVAAANPVRAGRPVRRHFAPRLRTPLPEPSRDRSKTAQPSL